MDGMTPTRPCPVCDVRLDDPTEVEGHAEGCRYPNTLEASGARLGRAMKQLTDSIVQSFRDQVRKLRP